MLILIFLALAVWLFDIRALALLINPAHPFWVGLLFAFVGVAVILRLAYFSFNHCDGPAEVAGGAFLAAFPLSAIWCVICLVAVMWR